MRASPIMANAKQAVHYKLLESAGGNAGIATQSAEVRSYGSKHH